MAISGSADLINVENLEIPQLGLHVRYGMFILVYLQVEYDYAG